jgi:NADPH:quinone reductase-like Zn-dependent oxidoreductase
MVTQLAREAGAYVIGTGRAADREKALDFGAHEFVDLGKDTLEDVGGVDLVFDVIGGEIQERSAAMLRRGGVLVSVVGPVEARPSDASAVDFVDELLARGARCRRGSRGPTKPAIVAAESWRLGVLMDECG